VRFAVALVPAFEPTPAAVAADVSAMQSGNPKVPPAGFGDDIRALQAGLVPDVNVLNTCNDPD
jgi:hypothetical protein